MKSILSQLIILISAVMVLLLIDLSAVAQDQAVDSTRRRPIPEFDHTLHEEAYEETGCGVCHHVFDEDKNVLVYSEGEESYCSDCHMEKAQGNILALREANHASCTVCHRKLKKTKKPAGPTTCGECHKKQS